MTAAPMAGMIQKSVPDMADTMLSASKLNIYMIVSIIRLMPVESSAEKVFQFTIFEKRQKMRVIGILQMIIFTTIQKI